MATVTVKELYRCDRDGIKVDDGSYARIEFEWTISASTTATIKWTDKNGNSNSTIVTLNGTSGISAKVFGDDELDIELAYTVEVTAGDATTTSTLSYFRFPIDIINGEVGVGVSIGKPAEKKDTFEVDLKTEFNKEVKFNHNGALSSLIDIIYPINSIYISYSQVNPSTLFGGTWVRIQDGFLWGSRETDNIGATGGSKTVTLTTEQLPSHTHGAVYSANVPEGTSKTLPWLSTGVLGTGDKIGYAQIATGGGQAHNNMPPYIQVSIWRRTA